MFKFAVMVHSHYMAHHRLYRVLLLGGVAVTLTIIGETGVGKFTFYAFGIRLLHLSGEVIYDRVIGHGFFHEGGEVFHD
jgi:hypothetical protein